MPKEPKSKTELLTNSNTNIRIAGWANDSITDGPGLRFVLFVQGCERNCPGCHNPSTHSRNGGRWTTVNEVLNEINRNPILDGITLSGGEPFLQPSPLAVLSKEVRRRSLSVVVYTGFTFEEILCSGNADQFTLLHETDILVDGPYIESERSLALKFRGSANQRVINVQQSLNTKKIIEHFW